MFSQCGRCGRVSDTLGGGRCSEVGLSDLCSSFVAEDGSAEGQVRVADQVGQLTAQQPRKLSHVHLFLDHQHLTRTVSLTNSYIWSHFRVLRSPKNVAYPGSP